MIQRVDDMYKFAKSHNLKLLSDFNADFWSDYVNNSARYDSVFRRMFLSFYYFIQDEDIEVITTNFIEDVYNHLMINEKRYEELYRIYQISDEDYSLTDNYNITEVMDRDTTSNNVNTYGERHDNVNTVQGQQNNSTVAKVSPYDTDNFYNDNSVSDTLGSRTDNMNTTKGEQSDTLNNTGTDNYTLTRKGNIGVQTATDMLDKHKKFWTPYEFYSMIFKEICKELLLV